MFFRMLRMHGNRLFQSKRFYMSILCMAGISLLSIAAEIQEGVDFSVYYLIQIRHGIGAFFLAMSVVIALPYGMNYLEDRKNHYEYGIMSRGDRLSYCWANVVVTALSAFLTVFFGYLILYGILRLRFPVIRTEELEILREYLSAQGGVTPYERLLLGNVPILYFLCTFFTEAIAYAFMAGVTLMFSAKITNAFVLLSVPLIFYQCSVYICSVFHLPWFFRWDYMLSHGGYFALITDRAWVLLLYLLAYFSCLTGAAGVVFAKWVEGKRNYG